MPDHTFIRINAFLIPGSKKVVLSLPCHKKSGEYHHNEPVGDFTVLVAADRHILVGVAHDH